MCTVNRPVVLSIAGIDPSAGAGILADIKTFEALGCYGLAVITANTLQDDETFRGCHWISEHIILQQLDHILHRFRVEVVKIGIIQNQVLLKIIQRLNLENQEIKIILDPVLVSSSGFVFQDSKEFEEQVEPVLDKIFLVTPNFQEIMKFFPAMNLQDSIQRISRNTNLYLKGGHRDGAIGMDELFQKNGASFVLTAERKDCMEKHGSGCVLSSAVAANLALGLPLTEACKKAKKYTEDFLASNKSLLGYHCL